MHIFFRSLLRMSRNSDKKKFYAVACGREPGIYNEWYGKDGAEAQVSGFPGARYRGFSRFKEAEDWLGKLQQPGLFDQSEIPTPEPGGKTDPAQEVKKGEVIIYTDGGCLNNPGPGGYGAVLLHGGKRKELSGGFQRTTNNRMELTACIEGLKSLNYPCSVNIFSDSQYVVNGIKKGWAKRWKRKGWMRTATDPAENADLWAQLLDLCDIHKVDFSWVKGHAGNKENERCDRLANKAALDKENLRRDTAFETGQTQLV